LAEDLVAEAKALGVKGGVEDAAGSLERCVSDWILHQAHEESAEYL